MPRAILGRTDDRQNTAMRTYRDGVRCDIFDK